jgi:hypothetical protein
MRMRLGCVAALALATLACGGPREAEPFPELLSCPSPHTLVEGEPRAQPGCALFDADRENGVADLAICERPGPPKTTDIEYSHSRFTVEYEKDASKKDVATTWVRPDETTPAPLELAPPELSRVIPSRQPPVERSCLAEPHVSAYLGELRDRTQGRWLPPPLAPGANRNVVVVLSLSASGEITGACFEPGPTVADSLGASVIRALQKAAPFASMTTEPDSRYTTETSVGTKKKTKTETLTSARNETECLAGRRVIVNFTAR